MATGWKKVETFLGEKALDVWLAWMVKLTDCWVQGLACVNNNQSFIKWQKLRWLADEWTGVSLFLKLFYEFGHSCKRYNFVLRGFWTLKKILKFWFFNLWVLGC